MRISTTKAVATAAAVTLALGTATALADSNGNGNGRDKDKRKGDLVAVGLVDGLRLVGFSTDDPADLAPLSSVSGLNSGARLVGIDYRVQDGQLYGVSSDGYVYRVAPATGVGTLASTSQLPLDGSAAYGVDVNPAANALRVISAKGQNLRVPLATANAAVAVDTPLTRPVVPATTPPSSEPAQGLTAAAYTNNDLDPATATTLFDLDTVRDQVVVQSPANSGLTAAAGAAGVDLALDSGFDVYTGLRKGAAASNRGFAVSGGVLYAVDLLTGAADARGAVPGVTDLAIPLDQG